MRQLGRETFGDAGGGVVVALGQVEGQAPGARLGTEHGLAAEVCRQQDREREPSLAHATAGVFGIAELTVTEQALGVQRLQQLGAEIHVACAEAQPSVLVHQRHRKLCRARIGVPDAGQHNQRIERRHHHRTECGPEKLGVAVQQGRVAGDGAT